MDMKRNDKTETPVIEHPSEKFQQLVGKLREQKLAQQKKLSEMKECTFSVSV